MNLTFKKLLLATIACVLLDIAYVWIRQNYGLGNWVSPKTLSFWAKDPALLVCWIMYAVQKAKGSKSAG